jgi:dTDP-4-amino-4,6-dideoxygalactose transaminase
MDIAKRHDLYVFEDAAQAILATIDGRHVGSWGDTASFSLHPLKNLNIWGDGGVIVTRSEELNDTLRLLRNHGLSTRDEVTMWGYNSRFDSLQAAVANRLLGQVHAITEKRIANARRFDEAFYDLAEYVRIPPRRHNVKQVFHTYVIQARDRDDLRDYLIGQGVEAKVHYPIPLHLQKAAEPLGYKKGHFPVCERHCETIITLPVHQHLQPDEIDYVIDRVRSFYLR